MEAPPGAAWDACAAGLLLALGVGVVVWGLRRHAPGLRRPATDPLKALALASCLRILVLGAALVALGAAWLWSLPPLAAAALVILAEETLEISVVVAALRSAPGVRAGLTRS
jgi:hypothetical protein